MKGMIAAVSPEGVIGVGGKIPWHYPADLRRFKRVTMGTAVVMGRKTYESVGRPLGGRRNLVVASNDIPGVETFRDVAAALRALDESAWGEDVWFIGGAAIYAAAMAYADRIDLTYVPDAVDAEGGLDTVRFPAIDPETFEAGPLLVHEDDPRLHRRVYSRISAAARPG